MDDFKLEIPNDINVKVSNEKNGVMLDENCCTCINIMLTNEGKIATSFLGSHNPYIVSQLEKAQKMYFKELKKALKKDYKEYADFPFEKDEDDCECGHDHDHHHDHGCEDCGDDCDCDDEFYCDDECDCGDEENHEPCNCEDGKSISEALDASENS